MRKHGWIRADNLRYQDNISNMELAIAKLVKAGFLSMKLNDIKEALNLLSKNELKEIAKEKKIVLNEANPVSTSATLFLFIESNPSNRGNLIIHWRSCHLHWIPLLISLHTIRKVDQTIQKRKSYGTPSILI